MNNKTYNQKSNKMKTRKSKTFNIERVKEFCNLVNEGKTPAEALRLMNSCNGYTKPLRAAGIFWQEKDGTFKAVERIRTERYTLFLNEKLKYNKQVTNKKFYNKSTCRNNSYKEYVKQATLFNQPKPKTTTPVPTMKAKQRELSFIQRVVKSLFKL